MAQYAQTKTAATVLDYTSTITKRGRLCAQNVDVTNTSDKESKQVVESKK
jgi:hypothetical protein